MQHAGPKGTDLDPVLQEGQHEVHAEPPETPVHEEERPRIPPTWISLAWIPKLG